MPHINNYREDIEKWASENVGSPVKIKSINAAWQGWTPFLYLNEINILDESGNNVAAELKSARISINPYISLLKWDFTPLKITVTGPALSVIRGYDGSIGFTHHDSSEGISAHSNQNNIFTERLLLHESISIEGATIDYIDLNKPDSKILLTDVNLEFRKSSARTQINISAQLPNNYGERVNLVLDIYGDITTPQWSGQIYLEGQQFYPGTLLKIIPDIDPSLIINSAPAIIKLWSSWNRGKLTKLEGQIAATNINMEYGNFDFNLLQLVAAFSVIHRQNNQYLAKFEIDNLVTKNGRWQKTTIDVLRNVNRESDGPLYISRADYLNIDDITPIINKLFPNYNFHEKNMFNPHGSLIDCLIIYDASKSTVAYFDTEIEDLSLEFTDSSVTSNSGIHLTGNEKGGLISFESPLILLNFSGEHEQVLKFYEVIGDVKWQQEATSFILESSHIESHTPHFNTIARGKVKFESGNARPYADFQINASNINVEDISHYLPGALPDKARLWSKQSLVSGEISTLNIIHRGYLDEFPYRDNSGQFKIYADFQNTILDFSQNWSPVKNMYAELEINNSMLNFHVDSGNIHNAEIKNVIGTIDDITGDHISLKITGNVSGNMQDAMFIIDNSPLSDSEMIARFKTDELTGNLILNLNLEIPFYESPNIFEGNLYFEDSVLDSQKYKIILDKITGNILFSRDHVTTEKLTARYLDTPVNLIIKTDDQAKLITGIEGDADAEFISEQLIHFFPNLKLVAEKLKDQIDGTCYWTATFSGTDNKTGNIQKNEDLLTIRSDLSGLALNLPLPINKNYTPKFLEINSTLSDEPDRKIQFKYGDQLTGAVNLQKTDTVKILSTELAVGHGEVLQNPGQGILVHGKLEEFDLSDWYNFFKSINPNMLHASDEIINIGLSTSNLVYYGQRFSNSNISILNNGTDWQVDIIGDSVDGQVIIPAEINRYPVSAYFKKLYLKNADDNKSDFGFDPRSHPPLELIVDAFNYNSFELGKMTLSSSRLANGLSIDSITFTKPDLSINGSGTWEYINGEEFSNFKFKLKADQMHTMLQTFDYAVNPIKDGEIKLKMNAVWQGSPMDFTLENISGDLTMDIENGYVLDIEPSAGRLFGLLSLQTLPRRLSLDFSDLFGEGFSFDQIEGTFTIESGNAYTNNLTMKGPSANIDITGRTGLIDKDYDQLVTVTPQISDSLPIASALFGPIGIGVGAVIFLAGELFNSIPNQIDKLLRYQYTIKGSWDKPVVEKFGSDKTPVIETSES